VDAVTFHVDSRETVALVGESGSGKTTIGRAILGLTHVAGGSIRFADSEVTNLHYRERRKLATSLQAVFQDPYSSLNPTRTIEQTLGETLRGTGADRADVADRVRVMLERVGLSADAGRHYPARFSGGQRQRIAIARALMGSPRLVVCDEPTSALDLSVQAQVLNLLRALQDEFDLSYLFISHDLAVVRHVAHRIIVLYLGRVMEFGEATAMYERPLHPYTRALLAAAPVPDPVQQRDRREERMQRASRPDGRAVTAQDSCQFAQRCPYAIDVCRTKRPSLEVADSGTRVACHRWRELEDDEQPFAAPTLKFVPR
jgi:oligopeptide/dipeptide ABC transporter ATP-binding protein